ncbi:MAG: di-trans,poly-cis-decaprenylcistransferase [Ignavibacteria bacterium GWB2_35_12]|nr:MAG: di-trans,poly-cis-decaprenylcistransferase [Ignavibacteria bacterium GWA2_35_8]OGU38640.1 MAG: di-trans,poly-cis-decaprenylcistransferase [Ignavibacteria bacterium GWB2_35_12]OGU93986.1 MAG: di-trans,poly-cis-decaprenylcistransferase [Ignavibacteria bacterium RIFOXYA2_FULL_35_10]OGV22843.1 MAG: di-trans,poly-cis-decaprenylcistransferase [Ignavibacteria bacterium RIFOXYC2_FULL_35_21]
MSWVKEQSPEDKIIQEEIIKEGNLPRHIAVIMDGNGRWAIERGLTRTEGHQEGIESVRDIVKASSQIGIKYLTLYAFSIENWKRPITEVGVLMKLLEHYLRQELNELHENNVKLQSIGKSSSLPKVVQKLLHEANETTKDNTGLTLTLALSYSGRWDIVRAVQMIALDVRRGKVSPEDINEDLFSSYLQTTGMPYPDFLIRTSGEMRLSNFLLWEMAYGEMYITDKYWPEFRRNDLYDALINFMNRERRFGKTSAQVASEKDTKQKDTYLQRVVNAIKGK